MDLEGHEIDRNMTPKEKAQELVDKYRNMDINFPDDNMDYYLGGLLEVDAIKMAIVTCAEVISQWEYIDTHLADGNGELNPNLRYWQEVKKELECI